MKGAAHYHSLPAQDNLVLKWAQNVNKLVSEVRMGTVSPVCCHLLYLRQTVKGRPQNEKFHVTPHKLHMSYQFPKNEQSVKSNSQDSLESNQLNLSLMVQKFLPRILTGLQLFQSYQQQISSCQNTGGDMLYNNMSFLQSGNQRQECFERGTSLILLLLQSGF